MAFIPAQAWPGTLRTMEEINMERNNREYQVARKAYEKKARQNAGPIEGYWLRGGDEVRWAESSAVVPRTLTLRGGNQTWSTT